MWENRKLASWVVSFFCLLCTLTHMRKQCYGKCDFCHRQTRCSEWGDDEKNGNLYTSQNFLPPAKTDYRQRYKNRKSKVFLSEHADEGSWPALLDFHQGRRAEAKPLSPALCMSACCCATDVHTICFCFLYQLVVFTLSASCRQGITRGWHCFLTTASLTVWKTPA